MGILDSLFGRFRNQPTAPKPEQLKVAKKVRTAVKQIRRPRQKKIPPKTQHRLVTEWRTEVQKIQKHPLTQAKIVNERLLASVMEMFNEINSKLDELSTRMMQLETIGNRPAAPQKPEFQLSTNEQKVVDFIKKKKEVVANNVADALRISRSNAALKLNKLASVGLLSKRQDGKDVYYKLA
ncbi:MAG TPA: helix-turn-helix domain-containing protein [Candidatus Nanoarchaeia archaeon]|nr:helix-turn-helix domain-containing protein [Candidatus Nanoarchaeia archaeon]